MADASSETAQRSPWLSMKRGWRQRCPKCGDGAIYGKFLKVNDKCPSCGQELFHHRADDAPPYFTMTIVGHVVVALVLIAERKYHPEAWVHFVLWAPLTIVLSLWLLPRIKGALIGMQWAMRMHGFGSAPDPALPEAWPGVVKTAAGREHA